MMMTKSSVADSLYSDPLRRKFIVKSFVRLIAVEQFAIKHDKRTYHSEFLGNFIAASLPQPFSSFSSVSTEQQNSRVAH